GEWDVKDQGLLDAVCVGADKNRGGEKRRVIAKSGERGLEVGVARRAKADAKRRGAGVALHPATVETGRADALARRLGFVVYPQQLEHGVVEKEPAVRGALAGMRVRGSFRQAKSH